MGLPERVEGNCPVDFMEDWLKSTLKADVFTLLLLWKGCIMSHLARFSQVMNILLEVI